MLLRLTLPLCALLLSHCALLDGDDETAQFTHAMAVKACGPADGPAFHVFITQRQFSCNAPPARSIPPDHTIIQLWVLGETEPDVPSTFSVGEDAESRTVGLEGASAERCAKGGECVDATGGSFRFLDGGDGAVKVSLDLRFEDGSSTKGEFVLRQCAQEAMCP